MLVFDNQKFIEDCKLTWGDVRNGTQPDKNAVYQHVDSWRAAILYAYQEAMKAVGKEIKIINPHYKVDNQQCADRIRVLHYRSHRESTARMFRLMGGLIRDRGPYNTIFDEMHDKIMSVTVVPTEKQFQKSKFKEVWDEVHEYATTNRVLIDLGMIGNYNG